MGPKVRAKLERHGFFSGRRRPIFVIIEPAARLTPLELNTRGRLLKRTARLWWPNWTKESPNASEGGADRLGWAPEELGGKDRESAGRETCSCWNGPTKR